MKARALLFAFLAAAGTGAHASEPYLVIVSGLGGENYYSDLFFRWATTLNQVAVTRFGLAPGHVIRLAEDPSRDPDSIAAISSKANVLGTIQRLANEAKDGDVLAIVYLGHATARGNRALLNLPGPDLSATGLAEALESLAGKTVVAVIAAPASAAFVETLSGPGRVVIAATSSASENQHTRFGGHFVDAFAENAADLDKDKRVSLLEAFRFATREVHRSFELEGRVRTEHAVLDDNGDGAGSRDPDNGYGDGVLAARVHLQAPNAAETVAGAEALALQIQARRLVDRIEEVKRKKHSLASADYFDQLEGLLVELAFNRRAYRTERTQ